MFMKHANMASTNALSFKVSRKTPELIPPAEPTPYQVKSLSDIDSLDILREQVPIIHFYRKCGSMEGKDPVTVTRDAIAKALVFYYPFAGRLREYGGRKLAVECTDEGVVFIEADADITLEQFGEHLHPPFPNLEELLPFSSDFDINSPLLNFQVTRLRCGGFILAYSGAHPICDGAGLFQFMTAVGELARGAAAPSIPPVWDRHLLSRRHDTVEPAGSTSDGGRQAVTPKPLDKTVQRNFFFDAADIAALRRSLPPHLQSCSKFDVVAACAWRCWTIAMSPDPDEGIVFMCVVDIRKQMKPPLPVGYYGNAIAPATVVTTAEAISKNPLHYAVELVRKAKSVATPEYVERLIMMDAPPSLAAVRIYAVSDVTNINIGLVDLGWGTAAYAGPAKGVDDWCFPPCSWYLPFEDKTGQQGVMVPACLPPHAMEVFATQLHGMMKAARTTPSL